VENVCPTPEGVMVHSQGRLPPLESLDGPPRGERLSDPRVVMVHCQGRFPPLEFDVEFPFEL
jgi:hypothetical protein